jgi:hypothetical protein
MIDLFARISLLYPGEMVPQRSIASRRPDQDSVSERS